MLIATVVGITTVAAATTARVALHQSVQTASHVRTWYRDTKLL